MLDYDFNYVHQPIEPKKEEETIEIPRIRWNWLIAKESQKPKRRQLWSLEKSISNSFWNSYNTPYKSWRYHRHTNSIN